jgi:hypothetical protein
MGGVVAQVSSGRAPSTRSWVQTQIPSKEEEEVSATQITAPQPLGKSTCFKVPGRRHVLFYCLCEKKTEMRKVLIHLPQIVILQSCFARCSQQSYNRYSPHFAGEQKSQEYKTLPAVLLPINDRHNLNPHLIIKGYCSLLHFTEFGALWILVSFNGLTNLWRQGH